MAEPKKAQVTKKKIGTRLKKSLGKKLCDQKTVKLKGSFLTGRPFKMLSNVEIVVIPRN